MKQQQKAQRTEQEQSDRAFDRRQQVEKMRNDQPEKGLTIATTFAEVGVELLSVKEQIQRLETSSAAVAAAGAIVAQPAAAMMSNEPTAPFTQTMHDQANYMYGRIAELDILHQGVRDLYTGAPAVGARLEALEAVAQKDQQDGALLAQACGGFQGLGARGAACGGWHGIPVGAAVQSLL